MKSTEKKTPKAPSNGSAVPDVARQIVEQKRLAGRQVIRLAPTAAVMSVINQVLVSQDAVRIALASFCEGRGLEGSWTLRITGADLVPVADPQPTN